MDNEWLIDDGLFDASRFSRVWVRNASVKTIVLDLFFQGVDVRVTRERGEALASSVSMCPQPIHNKNPIRSTFYVRRFEPKKSCQESEQ